MFFVFYVLIPLAFQLVKANNLAQRAKINYYGKGLTDIENFSKLKDARSNTSAPSFKSLFHIVQNISSNRSTTQNLKSNEVDKLLSDEMHSVKELIYGKAKPKISPPVQQTWPIIELMSKLNKIDKIQLDDYDINMLVDIAEVDEASTLPKELENVHLETHNITETTTANTVTTEVTNPVTYTRSKISTTTEKFEDFLEFKQLDEDQTVEQEESPLGNKIISLRSLYNTKRKPIARHSNHGACTCKKTQAPGPISVRCTANDDFGKKFASTVDHPCTSKKRHTLDNSEPSTSHICPTANCCHNPDAHLTYSPAVPCNPSVSCDPGTTCLTVLTTCYPIYPSSSSSVPTTPLPQPPPEPPPEPLPEPPPGLPPVALPAPVLSPAPLQPYPVPYNMYQPYQMFVEAPSSNIAEFRDAQDNRHHKHKRYKTKKKDDDYYDKNYNDYLEHDLKTAQPMLVTLPHLKHFREIVLKDNNNVKCHDECTRGIYSTDQEKFVNEVIGDLKTYYGDTVIKDCYCHALHSSASSFVFTSIIYISIFIFLLYNYFI